MQTIHHEGYFAALTRLVSNGLQSCVGRAQPVSGSVSTFRSRAERMASAIGKRAADHGMFIKSLHFFSVTGQPGWLSTGSNSPRRLLRREMPPRFSEEHTVVGPRIREIDIADHPLLGPVRAHGKYDVVPHLQLFPVGIWAHFTTPLVWDRSPSTQRVHDQLNCGEESSRCQSRARSREPPVCFPEATTTGTQQVPQRSGLR